MISRLRFLGRGGARLLLALGLVVAGLLKFIPYQAQAPFFMRLGIPVTDTGAHEVIVLVVGAIEMTLGVAIVLRRGNPPLIASNAFLALAVASFLVVEAISPGFSAQCGCFGVARTTVAEHVAVAGLLIAMGAVAMTPRNLSSQ